MITVKQQIVFLGGYCQCKRLGCRWGCLFCGEFFSSSFLFLGKAPAACLAVEAAVLLFQGNGRSAFHTKDLIHWFACHNVVMRKPSLTIQWTGIFMFTPIWYLWRSRFDCTCP